MTAVVYTDSMLVEMKRLYVDDKLNLKDVASKVGGSASSVRKALADSGVTVRTRGRVKGKLVGARKAKVVTQPTATPKTLANPASSVDSGDELEKFLNDLRKD